MTDTAPPPASDEQAIVDTLDALEDTLDALRAHDSAVPQWELCEGYLTALLCTRRDVPESEWLPPLLGEGAGGPCAPFESESQRTHFMMHLWQRQASLRHALKAQVPDLDDPRALHPAVLDWKALAHTEPDMLHDDAGNAPLPSLGQLWAMGFMAAVQLWPDEWRPPRDPDIADAMRDALDCIKTLTADDKAPAAFNTLDEKLPPSVSEQRLHDMDEAIYAVYDLYRIAQALGPRRPPATRNAAAGRNDPCPCGSALKYKKCCGR